MLKNQNEPLRMNLQLFSESDGAEPEPEPTVESSEKQDAANEHGKTDTVTVKDKKQNKPEFTKDIAFTAGQQEYVDYLVGKGMAKGAAKAEAKLPPKEKLEAFSKWEKDQQTEAERQAEQAKEFLELQTKTRQLEIKNAILESGIPKSLVKYALVDISEATDTESGIEEFKNSEIYKWWLAKQITPQEEKPKKNSFGAEIPPAGQTPSKEDAFRDALLGG